MKAISQLTSCEDVVLITLRNSPASMKFISGLFVEIAKKRINVDMISQTAPLSGKTDLSFTIDDRNLGGLLEVMSSLRAKYPELKSDICSGNCKISLSGNDMRDLPGVAEVFDVLSKIDTDILLITTSEIDISVLVSKSDFGSVVSLLKKSFSL